MYWNSRLEHPSSSRDNDVHKYVIKYYWKTCSNNNRELSALSETVRETVRNKLFKIFMKKKLIIQVFSLSFLRFNLFPGSSWKHIDTWPIPRRVFTESFFFTKVHLHNDRSVLNFLLWRLHHDELRKDGRGDAPVQLYLGDAKHRSRLRQNWYLLVAQSGRCIPLSRSFLTWWSSLLTFFHVKRGNYILQTIIFRECWSDDDTAFQYLT